MGILVFDIDGTLTQTSRIDGELYAEAVQAVLPGVVLDSFRHFKEFTDSAILRAIWSGQEWADYESLEAEVHRHFLESLRSAAASEPHSFAPVRGARRIFAEVRRGGWIPAVATGAWRASAELKLATAEIHLDGIPLATSTERTRRVDIIRLAVAEASLGTPSQDIVYVGDGVWDVRACRELGIGFLGRATGDAATRLIEEGARAAIEDFSDPAGILELLTDARALRLSGR